MFSESPIIQIMTYTTVCLTAQREFDPLFRKTMGHIVQCITVDMQQYDSSEK